MRLCTAKHIVQMQKTFNSGWSGSIIKKDNCLTTSRPILLIPEIKSRICVLHWFCFISLILAAGAYPFGDLVIVFSI